MRLFTLFLVLMAISVNSSVIEGRFDSSDMIAAYSGNPEDKDLLYEYSRDDLLAGIVSGIVDFREIMTDTMATLYERGMYEKIIRMPADNYEHVYIRALSMLATDDYTGAMFICDSMLNSETKPVAVAFSTIKANILYREKRYKEALELASSIKTDYGLYMQALVHYKENRPDQCIDYLKRIENGRIMEMKYFLLCEIYLSKEDFNKVIEYGDAFREQFSQSDYYYNIIYMMGVSYYRKGYFRKSIEVLEEIAYHSKNSVIKGNAYYLIGKNYFMIGDYSEMEKYLGFVKNPLIESDFKKNALFLDGKGIFFSGEYSKAALKLEQFIKEYPEDFLTPYAYQLLAQAYFYIGKYEKSRESISHISDPEFIVDKLVQMKYFIDYKEGEYADSIEAYADFLSKERKNPMRNEVFDFIIRNSDNDSLRTALILKYMDEFPDNERLFQYYNLVRDYLIFESDFTDMDRILSAIRAKSPEQSDEAMINTIHSMFELDMFEEVINFYSRHIEDYSTLYSNSLFDIGRALSETGNENAEIVWHQLAAGFNDEYSDSAFVRLAGMYLEEMKRTELDRLMEASMTRSTYLQAELMIISGLFDRNDRQYERSVNTLITAAETFGDRRNRAAYALIEAAESAFKMNERDYALILLQKAELLATDVDLLNTIKLRSSQY